MKPWHEKMYKTNYVLKQSNGYIYTYDSTYANWLVSIMFMVRMLIINGKVWQCLSIIQ